MVGGRTRPPAVGAWMFLPYETLTTLSLIVRRLCSFLDDYCRMVLTAEYVVHRSPLLPILHKQTLQRGLLVTAVEFGMLPSVDRIHVWGGVGEGQDRKSAALVLS